MQGRADARPLFDINPLSKLAKPPRHFVTSLHRRGILPELRRYYPIPLLGRVPSADGGVVLTEV